MTADSDRAELLARARSGCWCKRASKPCGYHEGFSDGLNAMADRIERNASREQT